MNYVCDKDKCTGCMACVASCSQNAITIVDGLSSYNATINNELCVNCGACHRVCQVCNPIELQAPIYWKQGWALEDSVRSTSSSGGYATAIAKAFVQVGAVCSCYFVNGEFRFKIAHTIEELEGFSGSKYVKSNPIDMYDNVKKVLKDGESCLVIALPCQIAGLKKYINIKYQKLLYTVDLICHGTPSPKLLDTYLRQHSKSLEECKNVRFRTKHKFGLLVDTDKNNDSGAEDSYILAFLHCLSYTDNCYACPYAKKERVSDLTLGDSWGTELGVQEREKGISIALAQSEKGKELLAKAKIHIQEVDINRAIEANHQLRMPSTKPQKWDFFFDSIKKNKSFDFTVFRICTKQYIKQIIKKTLPYLGIKL